MNTGKLFSAFLLSYFSYYYFFLTLPSWSDIFSADNEEFEKNKIPKTRVNVTIFDTFYRYPYTASAVICENQQSANNTRLTSNIHQNSIAEISKKHQFPEKTDIGTVKMVKDHCEATAR